MATKLKTFGRAYLEPLANEVVGKLSDIAEAAAKMLHQGTSPPQDSLVNPNSSAVETLAQARQLLRESYRRLASEPALARVVAKDPQGTPITYYICRTTPVSGVRNLASYRSPVGRLAAMSLGGDVDLPDGRVLQVLERARLMPYRPEGGWDSQRTVLEAEGYGVATIESLRVFLTDVERELLDDLVGEILEEVALQDNVSRGVRRALITKMELRDQPILDQYQDEIFRLPLDRRVVLLGPPGTGKTTTLIRRLGQKIDENYLSDEERAIVNAIANSSSVSHAHSWLMFTPTDLLKQYVKEAFAREDVPASDLRITTWAEMRHELGKNTFGVLRSAGGAGRFVLKDEIASLAGDAVSKPEHWYEDFNSWHRAAFRQSLLDSARELSKSPIAKAKELGHLLSKSLEGTTTIIATFKALDGQASGIGALVASLTDSSNAKIRGALNQQLNRDKSFLDELSKFLDEIHETLVEAEGQDADEDEEEEEQEETGSRTPIAIALKVYFGAVRSHARSIAAKRPLSPTSQSARVIEWLAGRTLPQSELIQVGQSLLALSSLRRLVNPARRYLHGVPARYRAFRRARQQEGVWYSKSAMRTQDIHPLELDLVLLAILRSSNELLALPSVQREIDSPVWSSLKPMRDLQRNQILVDEAPDFSPIQLACMAALANTRLRSFFACGDFNQRLTTWGTRSADVMKWIFPDIDVRHIDVAYRQSAQLNELGRLIVEAAGATSPPAMMPQDVDSSGVRPAILESASQPDAVDWIADRILDIERTIGQLPSTAVLVNSEDEVGPLAERLGAALAEDNVQVIACHEGRAMGSEASVRVFDVQHIKGLEFEAVFFVGVDRLEALQPELFDKYLYVGTTRAATYLGITCERELPKAMRSLRRLFVDTWGTT